MSLFIANLTDKTFVFMYRVGERQNPLVTTIKAGQQESIYPQGTKEDHEHIVMQHRAYGLVSTSEINKRDFFGHCFQYDSPVNINKLMDAREAHEKALQERSLEIRKASFVAANKKIEDQASENGVELKKFQSVMEEVDHKGKAKSRETMEINED